MPDNPYVREVTVTILEIVPDREELPTCEAWLGGLNGNSLEQCSYKARYIQNGRPVCGQHVGRGTLLWHPNAKQDR